jgi:DNA-directed RNA polymerase specialized sigma24 family protein
MPRVPAGDRPDDLGALYDRFARSLYQYALVILTDRAEAEDAVQQVFTALVRRGTGGLDSIEGYLRRAVRNECYSSFRRRRYVAPKKILRAAFEAVHIDPIMALRQDWRPAILGNLCQNPGLSD